eukprot:jgi/Bigna1/80727/fgenesh1_pg.73_\
MASSSTVSAVLSHPGVRWIGMGWAGFIAENLILSSNRKKIIDAYGDKNYHTVYSALSTLTTGSIAYGYLVHGRRTGPMRPLPSPQMRMVAIVCQTIGLVGLSQFLPKIQAPVVLERKESSRIETNEIKQGGGAEGGRGLFSFQAQCPFDFSSSSSSSSQKEASEQEDGSITGMKRVTRHPMFWTMSFLSAGVLFRTQFFTEVVMFSGPIFTTLTCGYHLDSRQRNGNDGINISQKAMSETSFIPFLALLEGRQSWSKFAEEIKM